MSTQLEIFLPGISNIFGPVTEALKTEGMDADAARVEVDPFCAVSTSSSYKMKTKWLHGCISGEEGWGKASNQHYGPNKGKSKAKWESSRKWGYDNI